MTDSQLRAAEELEKLGDDAWAMGDVDVALERYSRAGLLAAGIVLHQAAGSGWGSEASDALFRISTKKVRAHAAAHPPKPLHEQVSALRTAITESIESGHLSHAASTCMELGEILESCTDPDGAESAYRQAVALSRQVDADNPDLMLHTFTALLDFLEPSEESISLAQEMARHLVNRDEMFHPMRAAEAVHLWATTELLYAKVAPHRIDHVIDGIARTAIEAAHDICLHGLAQGLQRHIAATLCHLDRDADAVVWQTEADRYEDWEEVTDQVIPGHVHLWDLRFTPDYTGS